MSVQDDLTYLRDIATSLTKEDAAALKSWEKSLKKNELYKRWCEHPITKEVFAEFSKMVGALDARLSTEEEMTDLDRRSIFKVKPMLLWFLTLAHSKEATIEQLQKQIEQAATEFRNYNASPRRP